MKPYNRVTKNKVWKNEEGGASMLRKRNVQSYST